MGWLWGSDDNAVEQTQMDSQTLQSDAHDFNTHGQMVQTAPQSPLFALDQLKASGIPLRAQMTPYLQVQVKFYSVHFSRDQRYINAIQNQINLHWFAWHTINYHH